MGHRSLSCDHDEFRSRLGLKIGKMEPVHIVSIRVCAKMALQLPCSGLMCGEGMGMVEPGSGRGLVIVIRLKVLSEAK